MSERAEAREGDASRQGRDAAALALARQLFGGAPKRLPGEFDFNFAVEGPDGPAVVKLAPPSRRPLFELLAACLVHLEGAELRARVPRLVDAAASGHPPENGPRDPSPSRRASGGSLVADNAPGAGRIATLAGPDGEPWIALAATFVEGGTLATARPRSMRVLRDLGALLAELHAALSGFEHAGLDREQPWRMETAPDVVRARLADVAEPLRALVAETASRAERRLDPVVGKLASAPIHNDANDHNVIVEAALPAGLRLAGLIDFGDVVRGWRVADCAVAAAYASMDLADPMEAASAVAAGYASVAPLTEDECRAFVPLLALRLCLSICVQARQMREQPENEYLAVSQRPARRLLGQLADTDWRLAEFRIRDACGFAPNPAAAAVAAALEQAEPRRPVLPAALLEKPAALDLSVGSLDLPHPDEIARPGRLDAWVEERLAAARATVGVGRWDEARLLYDRPSFATESNDGPGGRTVHLGLDLFAPAGTPVRSPLAGAVSAVANNAGARDYGPTLIVRHATDGGAVFHTLYGHLSKASLDRHAPGDAVAPGDELGRLGSPDENGGWPPHLHFQVVALDSLDDDGRPRIAEPGDFPGVAEAGLQRVWESVAPDPTPLAGLPAERVASLGSVPRPAEVSAGILEGRARRLGPSLSLAYDEPVHVVRGLGPHLFDAGGRRFLDLVNNVAHVGHANPRVARAIARQSRLLNTNTRYLHQEIVALSDELATLLPPELEVVFLVCSGSEANELALRLARRFTGREGIVALDGAYHGNTGGLVEISPYKFDAPGGAGRSPRVAVAPMPDPYRGLDRWQRRGGPRRKPTEGKPGHPDANDALGPVFAEGVATAARQLNETGPGTAAFFVEAMMGCGGQIEPPPGYLQAAFAHVRDAGGLCVADEVQTGFGRVGDAFWAFELQGVTPDIVTLGKPMGNGHPVGAVATTRAVADAFAAGPEYFNTFGGNPVACAAARAVLAEVRDRDLQEHARDVGRRLLASLGGLASPLVGDVRGRGLFLGVELVRDRERRLPFPEACRYVVNRLRRRGVLASADGPDANVLKIKPPLVFDHADAAHAVEELGTVLAETALAEGAGGARG